MYVLSGKLYYWSNIRLYCWSNIFIVPSVAPSDVTAVAASSVAVNVTWMPVNPQSVNGVALGYRVRKDM